MRIEMSDHHSPHIPSLVKFLKSSLEPAQIDAMVGMLREEGHSNALDPEAVGPRPGPVQQAAPQSIVTLLDEMEAAYSVQKFAPLTAEESRRVRDAYPGFIERCSANQGRHLCKMLRERFTNV
jgi:hypothetical protein